MGYSAKPVSDVSIRPPIVVHCHDNAIELTGEPVLPPAATDVDALCRVLARIAQRASSVEAAPTKKAA